MNIVDTYKAVTADLRKSRNGFYSISQFNGDAYRAVLWAFNDYFEGYSATQKLHDALSVFKETMTFTNATSVGGKITMPDDYGHALNGMVSLFDNVAGKKRVDIRAVNEDELSSALRSRVRPVAVSSPILVGGNKVIQLYPAIPQAGEINYLRLPKKPVYAYDEVGRKPVYDAGASQDIEFNDLYMPNIIAKIVEFAAQYLDDQSSTQYSLTQQKQTA